VAAAVAAAPTALRHHKIELLKGFLLRDDHSAPASRSAFSARDFANSNGSAQ
jgi:hypothetical protein